MFFLHEGRPQTIFFFCVCDYGFCIHDLLKVILRVIKSLAAYFNVKLFHKIVLKKQLEAYNFMYLKENNVKRNKYLYM
jgi:hypothetical protein